MFDYMADRFDVLQGTLDLLICGTLPWGPRFDGPIQPDLGLTEKSQRARFYRLTAAGRQPAARTLRTQK